MRTWMIAALIALLCVPAYGQRMGKGGGRHSGDQQSEEQKKKSKAADEAYKSALDKIPKSDRKADPWRNTR